MGRNSGSQIRISDTNDGTDTHLTWYCQQHAKWDQDTTNGTLKSHLENEHGCVRQ